VVGRKGGLSRKAQVLTQHEPAKVGRTVEAVVSKDRGLFTWRAVRGR